MLLDRVSNPGPLTCESGVLPIALRGPAILNMTQLGRNTFSKFCRCKFCYLIVFGTLKVGSCPNEDNSVQILFCPSLCSI